MSAISFSGKTKEDWESFRVSEIIRNLIRILALKFDGLILTSLIREISENRELGGNSKSKHIPANNPSRKCEAVDFVLRKRKKIEPDEVIDYVYEHFTGLTIIYHDAGTGYHFHLQNNCQKGVFPMMK